MIAETANCPLVASRPSRLTAIIVQMKPTVPKTRIGGKLFTKSKPDCSSEV